MKSMFRVLSVCLSLVPAMVVGQTAPVGPTVSTAVTQSNPAAASPPAATLGPAPATSRQPQPLRAAQPGEYVVNAGDQIEVYVWGEERLQRSLRILPDGSFSFPLVGRLVAAGKTLPQIEGLVSNGLQSQYRGEVPQVTVSVTAPSGLQFSVVGRVKAPGTFTPGRYVNLLEALTLAGGPDEFANLDNVVIIRKLAGGLTSIRARLGGIYRGALPAGAVGANVIPAVESGDTVIVP